MVRVSVTLYSPLGVIREPSTNPLLGTRKTNGLNACDSTNLPGTALPRTIRASCVRYTPLTITSDASKTRWTRSVTSFLNVSRWPSLKSPSVRNSAAANGTHSNRQTTQRFGTWDTTFQDMGYGLRL